MTGGRNSRGGHLDHAYARTNCKSQGATVDRCHHLCSAAAFKESVYVGPDRGREANYYYVVEAQYETSPRPWPRSRAQILALDQGPVRPTSSKARQRARLAPPQQRTMSRLPVMPTSPVPMAVALKHVRIAAMGTKRTRKTSQRQATDATSWEAYEGDCVLLCQATWLVSVSAGSGVVVRRR
jgi:hypothetical protein